MKVQISFNDALLQQVDDYCDKNYMTRSGFFQLCC